MKTVDKDKLSLKTQLWLLTKSSFIYVSIRLNESDDIITSGKVNHTSVEQYPSIRCLN